MLLSAHLLASVPAAAVCVCVCDGQTVAGVLFFWSYMLLVFLILLNFLLAIIVDAFSEIKGATHEQTGKPTDESAVHQFIIYNLICKNWCSSLRCHMDIHVACPCCQQALSC